MKPTYWHKQTPETPLFPDLLWSRPENRAHAGKLLVVGGHAQSFARPAEAYGYAQKAGAGATRVILPDVLQKTVGKIFPEAEFGPSTPSGSFAAIALGELLGLADWSDGVLLAGDFGRNSETAILLEKFATKYQGQLTITCDAVDYFISTPAPIVSRPGILLVLSFAQLQKLAMQLKYPAAFTFNMDLLRLIETLHDFTVRYQLFIITKHLDNIIVSVSGQVSTTKLITDKPVWRLEAAARASVWWLQNPAKPFEAITTGATDH